MPIRSQLLENFRERRGDSQFWLHVLIFACLGFAFLPVTQWFAATAQDQSRLLHALIVLGLATVFLIRFGEVSIVNPLRMNRSARVALYATFVFILLSSVAQRYPALSPGEPAPVLKTVLTFAVLPAYCCAIASFALFVFGEGTRRVVLTTTASLCLFLFLSTLMVPFDWPLRTLAGEWSAFVLGWLGRSVEMGLLNNPQAPPQLILVVDAHPFHVASECNGFGVILTALLVAFLLAVYRRLGPLDMALNVLAGITMGFAFNIVRIVIIVLLAPSLMSHYDLMHEIVGGITYWACLILTWLMLNGPVREEA